MGGPRAPKRTGFRKGGGTVSRRIGGQLAQPIIGGVDSQDRERSSRGGRKNRCGLTRSGEQCGRIGVSGEMSKEKRCGGGGLSHGVL